MPDKSVLEKAFENDDLSISQISDHFNLPWNRVQEDRAKYRKAHGLKPLNRARKKGFTA